MLLMLVAVALLLGWLMSALFSSVCNYTARLFLTPEEKTPLNLQSRPIDWHIAHSFLIYGGTVSWPSKT